MLNIEHEEYEEKTASAVAEAVSVRKKHLMKIILPKVLIINLHCSEKSNQVGEDLVDIKSC